MLPHVNILRTPESTEFSSLVIISSKSWKYGFHLNLATITETESKRLPIPPKTLSERLTLEQRTTSIISHQHLAHHHRLLDIYSQPFARPEQCCHRLHSQWPMVDTYSMRNLISLPYDPRGKIEALEDHLQHLPLIAHLQSWRHYVTVRQGKRFIVCKTQTNIWI